MLLVNQMITAVMHMMTSSKITTSDAGIATIITSVALEKKGVSLLSLKEDGTVGNGGVPLIIVELLIPLIVKLLFPVIVGNPV